jgi:hypothetical protein
VTADHVSFTDMDARLHGQYLSKHIHLSKNVKTGISINSRIEPCTVELDGILFGLEGTCQPTEWCRKKCYARQGHFATWNKKTMEGLSVQQRRYLMNSLIFNHYDYDSPDAVDREADHIVGQAVAEGFNNVRWNGGGDLSPGAVKIINAITARHPNFLVWGFTRRPDMALQLAPRPNLVFTVSLDPLTPPWGAEGAERDALLVAAYHLGGRMAYATEIPGDPKIRELEAWLEVMASDSVRLHTVFGHHVSVKHTVVGHRRECPATSKKDDVGCQKCRWCFMPDSQLKSLGITSPLISSSILDLAGLLK